MMQRMVELSDEQVQALARVAADDGRSEDDILQLVVGAYLARRGRDWSDWNRRFDAFVERVRADVPADLSPEEIEAEITANWREYRAEQSTERATTDAGGR